MAVDKLGVAMATLALPLPAATTTGVVLQNETKNPVYEVAGKILQMTSISLISAFSFYDNFWAQKEIIGITSVILLAPLMIKGLKVAAERYEFTDVKTFLDVLDKIAMGGVKVINIALISYGIVVSAVSGSPLLVGIYLSLFLLNLYPTVSKVTHDYLIPYLISNYQEKRSN